MLADGQLIRYSRQIMVDGIDVAGQESLLKARVLIIGMGGLGNPAASYLAAAGVGSLSIVDDDEVEASNLHRQLLHRDSRIGEKKVLSAKKELNAINAEVKLETTDIRLDDQQLEAHIQQNDLVLDCTDNFTSRHQINALCWKNKIPLIVGAAIRWEGQLSVFDANNADSPCYECLYPRSTNLNETCTTNGIIGPIVGLVGTYQALQAIKVLTGAGSVSIGKLWIFDGRYNEFNSISLPKRPDCPVCGE